MRPLSLAWLDNLVRTTVSANNRNEENRENDTSFFSAHASWTSIRGGKRSKTAEP